MHQRHLIHCQRTHKPADVRLEIRGTSSSRSTGTTSSVAAAAGQPVTTTTAAMAREVLVVGTTPLSTWLSMRTKVSYSLARTVCPFKDSRDFIDFNTPLEGSRTIFHIDLTHDIRVCLDADHR